MSQTNNDALLKKTKQLLDQSSQAVNTDIRQQLAQARMHAVDKQRRRTYYWRPALGVAATIGVVMLSFNLWFQSESKVQPDASGWEDMELLSSHEDMELLQDLDFYLWLEHEQAKETS
ncbi:MAG: hypothetical protein OEY38_01895 [Gammaproteobacteria bacterium]|nr:hypothetical protein [Gammaproteobacteria bacterium]